MNKIIILFTIILSAFLLFGCTGIATDKDFYFINDTNAKCDTNFVLQFIDGNTFGCIPVDGNIDTNWVYANVVWADRNRGYGTMYCADGNVVVGYLLGYSC